MLIRTLKSLYRTVDLKVVKKSFNSMVAAVIKSIGCGLRL